MHIYGSRWLLLGKVNIKLSDLFSQLFNSLVCICVRGGHKFSSFPFASNFYSSIKISRFRGLNINSKLRAKALDKELDYEVIREGIFGVNTSLQFSKPVNIVINRAGALFDIEKLFLPNDFLFWGDELVYKHVFKTSVCIVLITKSNGLSC